MKKSNHLSIKFISMALLSALLIFCSILLIFSSQIINANAATEIVGDELDDVNDYGLNEEERIEILSYENIFKSYYDTAKEAVSQDGFEMCSYSNFRVKYYESGLDLPAYTEAVITNHGNLSNIEKQSPSITPNSSSSSDENYIIKYEKSRLIEFRERGYDEYTPASVFQRAPVYGNFNYSSVKKGDIVVETQTILNDIGHTGFIYDVEHTGAYGNYIQVIEPVKGGVQFGFLDDTRMVNFQVIIYRVRSASDDQINTAANFCYKQLGKDYNLSAAGQCKRLNTKINSEDWYCSELMYAAYLAAGINMTDAIADTGGCWPIDIANSVYTSAVTSYVSSPFYSKFLKIEIVGKSGITWTIKVTNKTSSDIEIYYNSKMCFMSDAKTWENLSHVVDIPLNAGQSEEVKIKENWFATSVAFSYEYEGKQLITAGDRLNSGNKTMSVDNYILDNSKL